MTNEIEKLIGDWAHIMKPKVPVSALQDIMRDIYYKLGKDIANQVWNTIQHRYPDLNWSEYDKKINKKPSFNQ